jgi:hypothetical protein
MQRGTPLTPSKISKRDDQELAASGRPFLCPERWLEQPHRELPAAGRMVIGDVCYTHKNRLQQDVPLCPFGADFVL